MSRIAHVKTATLRQIIREFLINENSLDDWLDAFYAEEYTDAALQARHPYTRRPNMTDREIEAMRQRGFDYSKEYRRRKALEREEPVDNDDNDDDNNNDDNNVDEQQAFNEAKTMKTTITIKQLRTILREEIIAHQRALYEAQTKLWPDAYAGDDALDDVAQDIKADPEMYDRANTKKLELGYQTQAERDEYGDDSWPDDRIRDFDPRYGGSPADTETAMYSSHDDDDDYNDYDDDPSWEELGADLDADDRIRDFEIEASADVEPGMSIRTRDQMGESRITIKSSRLKTIVCEEVAKIRQTLLESMVKA